MNGKRFIMFMVFWMLMLSSMAAFADDTYIGSEQARTVDAAVAAVEEMKTFVVTVNGISQEVEAAVPIYDTETYSTSFDSELESYFDALFCAL